MGWDRRLPRLLFQDSSEFGGKQKCFGEKDCIAPYTHNTTRPTLGASFRLGSRRFGHIERLSQVFVRIEYGLGNSLDVALLIVFSTLAAAGAYAGGTEDRKRIQGAWDVMSVTDGGRAVPAEKLKGAQIILTKDELIAIMEGEKKVIGTYTLNPSEKPKHIDLKTEGKYVMKGIYELDGNSLKLCFNEDPTGARATAFESKKGSPNDLLFVLKRKKD